MIETDYASQGPDIYTRAPLISEYDLWGSERWRLNLISEVLRCLLRYVRPI